MVISEVFEISASSVLDETAINKKKTIFERTGKNKAIARAALKA